MSVILKESNCFLKNHLSDEWVELCDDQIMEEEAPDIESCLEICKNDGSCARANWYPGINIGLCRMFTIGAVECQQDRGEPQHQGARRVVNKKSMSPTSRTPGLGVFDEKAHYIKRQNLCRI